MVADVLAAEPAGFLAAHRRTRALPETVRADERIEARVARAFDELDGRGAVGGDLEVDGGLRARKRLLAAGSRLDQSVADAFADEYGIRILSCYHSTEAATIALEDSG